MGEHIDIEVHRLYDDRHGKTGFRVLVDRLWPRGVRKDDLAFDEWDKDAAPSNELRKRFHSGALSFAEFREAYRAELEESGAGEALLQRFRNSRKHSLVLLYGAKDETHNHARVLAEHLQEQEQSHGRQ
ncbi:DUF488 family protein [Brevibacterium sp.]|jgi:uncharacterized protein YeaO (DUF488 family)|uniref:DUF488 domain-containing protein n=1 Tax=Brevibacterium sp. TaxID=1701 RepID=UPI0025BB1DE6|nr:DUF488 family protein [Brevibacterium sp.]